MSWTSRPGMARTPALKSMPAVACDAPCSTTNWSTPVDTLNEVRSSTRTVAGTEAVASVDDVASGLREVAAMYERADDDADVAVQALRALL